MPASPALRRPTRRTLHRSAIPLGDGFAVATRWRTFSRWQRALPGPAEYPRLLAHARRQAEIVPPNPHRMVLAIASRIQAEIKDGDGARRRVSSAMSAKEVEYCRRCFAAFTELAFACSGGALRIEATQVELAEAATRLTPTGSARYWLSASDAFAGRESLIPQDQLDSLAVYYKMPRGVVAGLHGGAVGRDRGLRGTAFFTLWVTDWNEPVGPFNRTVIASLHEWLHNVSFCAHRVMGETAVPDCHAGEEYGYWDTDGGYPQWQAWNRDLMLHYTPRRFWYRLTSRGPLRPPEFAPPTGPVTRIWAGLGRAAQRVWSVLPHLRRLAFYRWRDVGDDWMRRLPRLDDRHLRSLTGLGDLRLNVVQPQPNAHVVWALQTARPVASPYAAGDPLRVGPALDNVLSFGRLPSPGSLTRPIDAFVDAPLEAIGWLRSPRAPRHRRDLLLLRVDLAPWILGRLRVVGRPADESVLGYVARRDPSEGQRVNVIVAAVDFGDHPPHDELEACGL